MNMGIMAGAPTVNSTNVYPAMERWKLLDPEGDRQEVYNRYAHIKVKIKAQGKAEFKMDSPDLITVTMTIADAKKLGVKYIITQNDLSQYGCDKVDSQGQFAVYQIEK